MPHSEIFTTQSLTLHLSIIDERIRRARLLLTNVAYIDLAYRARYTPLHVAAANGDVERVHMLLWNWVNAKLVSREGISALHIASACGYPQIVSMLLNYDANIINIRDKENCNSLYYALTTNRTDCARILLRHGAAVNTCDIEGFTPLHVAVASGNNAAVQALIRSGANVNTPNYDGLTPLSLAQGLCLTEIIVELINAGAISEVLYASPRVPVPHNIENNHVNNPLYACYNPYYTMPSSSSVISESISCPLAEVLACD